MIIEAVFNMIVSIILGVINLFPAIPQIKTDGLDGIFQALSLIDSFVSLKTISTCLVTAFIFMNLQTLWSVIMWVVRKIPGIK